MTLDLGNVISATVYVQYDSKTGLEFSPDNVTWVSGPIQWEPLAASTKTLILTFTYESGIISITSNSTNMVQRDNPGTYSIFGIATTPGNDPFTVATSNGNQTSLIAVIQPLKLDDNNTSQTVYVQDASPQGLLFSPDKSHWYTAPINWSPANSIDTFSLTFICNNGTTGVTTTSPNITQSTNSQDQPVFTITPTKACNFFSVTKSDHTTEDPKIIVTPQQT